MTRNPDDIPMVVRALSLVFTGRRIAAITLALLLLLSVAPLGYTLWWAFELPSHFRLHMSGAAAALALVSAAGNRILASIAAFVALANIWTLVALVPDAPFSELPGVTIISQNLDRSNRNFTTLPQLISEEDPDIVVLQEYTPEWHAALADVAARYRTVIAVPRRGAFGIAVFSKLPVSNQEVLRLGDSDIPFVAAEFESAEFPVLLVAVHFLPPTRPVWHAARQRQLADLQAYLQNRRGPFVVIGDFNNTPASPTLRTFAGRTGAHLATPYWMPTWPSILGWAGIPIDLALGSPDVRFGPLTRLARIGSDHRGLKVSVSL